MVYFSPWLNWGLLLFWCFLVWRIIMKIAQEYKGYYLDVFYKNGVVNGIIQQTQDRLQGLTVEEVVREFKKKVNHIS